MDARWVVCAAVSIDPAQTLTLGRSAARIAASNIRRRAIIWEREYLFAALLLLHGKRIRILDIDAPKSQQDLQALSMSEWDCDQWATNKLAESEPQGRMLGSEIPRVRPYSLLRALPWHGRDEL